MMLTFLALLLAVPATAPPATATGAGSAVAVTAPTETLTSPGSTHGRANTEHPVTLPGLGALALHRGRATPEDADATRPSAGTDSMTFTPIGAGDEPIHVEPVEIVETGEWLRAPIGDNLLTDPGRWRAEGFRPGRLNLLVDYNRVDQLRIGGKVELQDPFSMAPRFGGRLEYATGRKRVLYGVQVEQPLAPPGRLALGVSMVRRTDHSELQQVDDFENTLALLFGRQDYRDYFEREGVGVYLSWRVPDFSTVSVHARTDDFRSLAVNRGTRSWFQRDRTLRDNPAIDDGTEHSAVLRLERLAQTTSRTRAGLYHWIEVERAGAGFGGDFDFTRALADLRSVLRLTPGTTLSLRAVGEARSPAPCRGSGSFRWGASTVCVLTCSRSISAISLRSARPNTTSVSGGPTPDPCRPDFTRSSSSTPGAHGRTSTTSGTSVTSDSRPTAASDSARPTTLCGFTSPRTFASSNRIS